MANATPSRLGQINTTGSATALFLKIFAGEVLTAFNNKNVMMDKHKVRNITQGQSAQFPATHRATASYHTPGAEITGQLIKHGERVLTIDDLLISDSFVALIDELKNHYEVRAEYAEQQALALTNQFDRTIMQVLVLAARTAADGIFTGAPGGTSIIAANAGTDGPTLRSAIFQAATALDDKLVPDEDRYVVLRPIYYNLLIEEDANFLLHRDIGGVGSVATGSLPMVNGFRIVKSTQVPNSNVTGTFGNKYDVNASTVVAIPFHKAAAGTVKLLDLTSEAEYDIRRQGTLLLSKMAVGHGVLRPECACEIKTA